MRPDDHAATGDVSSDKETADEGDYVPVFPSFTSEAPPLQNRKNNERVGQVGAMATTEAESTTPARRQATVDVEENNDETNSDAEMASLPLDVSN